MLKRVWAEARIAAMRGLNLAGNIVGKVWSGGGDWLHKQKEKLAVSLHAEGTLAKNVLRKRISSALKDVLPKKTQKSLANAFKARVVLKAVGNKQSLGFTHLSNKSVAEKWLRSYRSQWIYAKNGMLAMLAFGLLGSEGYDRAKQADEKLVGYVAKLDSSSPIDEEIKIKKYSKKTVEEVASVEEVEEVEEATKVVEAKPPTKKEQRAAARKAARLAQVEANKEKKEQSIDEVVVEALEEA